MTTLDLHPWNFMPTEILEHIFSFLPVRERHHVSCTCNLWATAVSSASVWSFTEVLCDSEETDEEEEEEEDGYTSCTLLRKIHPYMGHIRYLKIVLDMSLELNCRLACTILDLVRWKSRKMKALQIMCYGKSRCFYSGQDLLHSLGWLFHGMDAATMQHIDFRHVPFTLNNRLISLVGSCSPNLRTLLIDNHVSGLTMVRTETIVQVLRSCPKLSTLGISYFALSQRVFQELLRPNREPFKYLELFYDGKENDIPAECWASMRERYPGFRVGLEFAVTVTEQKMTQVLKPYLPISQLRFNAFTHMANQVKLASDFYAGTLERLLLHSAPSTALNLALIWLARACVHLKEIHCFCVVAKGVVEVFRRHCPHLKKYTLSPTVFLCDNPPTVVL